MKTLKLIYLTLFFFTSFLAGPVLTAQIDYDEIFEHDFWRVDFYKLEPIDGKRVKEVKVWRQFKESSDVMLAEHYTFRSDGLITSLKIDDVWDEFEFYFTYAPDGKFHRVHFNDNEGDTSTYLFAYKDGLDIVERHFNTTIRKEFYYKDKDGKLIEKKVFFKDKETNEPYRVGIRKVFNYNAQGQLFGEMYYRYTLDGEIEKEKTIHKYDPESGKKTHTDDYNHNAELLDIDEYFYDDKGRLVREVRKSGILENYIQSETKYFYKNGQLSRMEESIFNYGNPKDVLLKEYKVFRDGRLVFEKFSNKSGLIYQSNFQYITGQ